MIENGEAARAAALLETFIAGCYEKSDEIDDSDSDFGMFVEALFCDWIRARQACGASADETVEMLITWMEADNWGYSDRIDFEAMQIFNRAGLDALERAMVVRMRSQKKGAYGRHRAVDVLKAIYEKRRDAGRYAAILKVNSREPIARRWAG